jgi:hypothetical protein
MRGVVVWVFMWEDLWKRGMMAYDERMWRGGRMLWQGF